MTGVKKIYVDLFFNIPFIMKYLDGNRNQNELEVLVVLLDVNDNAPELPTPDELRWTVSESLNEVGKNH